MNVSGINEQTIARLSPVMSKANHVRQLGSLALELCHLAKGSLDASIDFRGKCRPVDLAAAYLIVKEAGGLLYSADGKELDAELGVETRVSFLAAANKKTLKELSEEILE
jgi:myo-inositol-1(or 4)-monophosphatase